MVDKLMDLVTLVKPALMSSGRNPWYASDEFIAGDGREGDRGRGRGRGAGTGGQGAGTRGQGQGDKGRGAGRQR